MPESHPHDHLFRATFSSPENALGILEADLPPVVLAALESGSLELEEGSFVDDELRGQESDLLFRARLRGRPVRLYILIEHQSSVDPLMPLRLLRYVVRIWERWLRQGDGAPSLLPAVIPLVLFHGSAPWDGPRRLADLLDLPGEVRAALAPYVPAFDLLIDDLAVQGEASLATRRAGILGRLSFVFLKAALDGSDLLSLLERTKPLVQELARSAAGRDGLGLILRYIMSVRDVQPRAVVEQVQRVLVTVAGDEVMKSTYDQILDEGRAEGRAEGHAEGIRRVLTRQLERKFGPLPDAARHRLESAAAPSLELWCDRVLTASSLEDVFAAV